jgi:transposase
MISAKTQLEKSPKEFGRFHTARYSSFFKRLNKSAIGGINESLSLINDEIQCAVKKDHSIQKQTKLLNSVPGIGIITALHLICYTNEFTMCQSGKQLACYAGVAPFEHSSGSSVRGKSRVSHIANKKLKALLHLCAKSGIRIKNGELGKYYKKKLSEGKHRMSVLNAIKNKIILRAVAVIKRGTPYVAEQKIKPRDYSRR